MEKNKSYSTAASAFDKKPPVFAPEYITKRHTKDLAVNAMIEVRALWRYVIERAHYDYSLMYAKLKLPLNPSVIDECNSHKENFDVYDTKQKKWLISGSTGSKHYKFYFDGKTFIELTNELRPTSSCNTRLLLVGKYTELMQEPKLVKSTHDAQLKYSSFVLPTIRLIVGVPGCGKTSYIIDNHEHHSLVLTSCREGAEDIRERIDNELGQKGCCRTIDSYLINRTGMFHLRRRPYIPTTYSEVWMDEALMEHPGKIFLACLYSRCNIIHLLGDPNQLGFINRVNEIKLQYEKSSLFFQPTKSLNTSYRCPVDVITIISHKYEDGAYSASSKLRSLKWMPYKGLESVPKEKDTKYLVFKQKEKEIMRKAGYDVSTIHEYQGKQTENIIIVRMSKHFSESLYESPPHILVGMTRHTNSLVYYSPIQDKLVKMIQKHVSDSELRQHQKTSPQESLCNILSKITLN